MHNQRLDADGVKAQGVCYLVFFILFIEFIILGMVAYGIRLMLRNDSLAGIYLIAIGGGLQGVFIIVAIVVTVVFCTCCKTCNKN